MIEKLRFLGLDVHAETITVAVAEADGEVRSLGNDCRPRRVDPQVDQKTWTGRASAGPAMETVVAGHGAVRDFAWDFAWGAEGIYQGLWQALF